MSFLTAAETILRSAKRPLTVREVTEGARRRELISPDGKTPEATMSSALYRAVKKDPNGPLRREFTPGRGRAARESVRWVWVGRGSS